MALKKVGNGGTKLKAVGGKKSLKKKRKSLCRSFFLRTFAFNKHVPYVQHTVGRADNH